MSFLSLLGAEFLKMKRSGILWILLAASVLLWIPSIVNVDLSFGRQAEGILPENYFFIQGFMAMAWFLFPAGMVVATVLLSQTERADNGIIKMLSCPVNAGKLCLTKFIVLLVLAAVHLAMTACMYYVSAAIVSRIWNYPFLLSPFFVGQNVGKIFLSGIPMLAVFWMLAVCIQTPVFSVGIGLASIVPSVLMINTKIWFAYPMAYPFFVIASEYKKLAWNFTMTEMELLSWIPVAVAMTLVCLCVACLRFGRAERR